MEVNGRQVRVHIGNGIFELKKWENVNVGDVVMVERDAFFPADLLLLSSSYPDGICYVETMNLDGETNLKIRKSLEATAALDSDSVFAKFGGFIKCEDPNPNLYTFIGSIEISGKVESLSAQQVLLRDSKLRNTHYIYGVVIFSGHDTKVMQNATQPPSKRSSIERKMDQIIYVLFLLLLSISFIGSVVFGVSVKIDMPLSWYLRPDSTGALFRPVPGSFLHFVTALILYGYLIPISLYVSIEVVKIVQAKFINQDLHMFHDQTDKPAHARTSNLNEELGQVETILSDKTGTLTCNVMDFLKCSICGVQYGRGISEVERAVSSRLGKSHQQEEISSGIEDEQPESIKPKIKNFSFNDERLLNGNWINEKASGDILMFFHILAVCHTAIPEEDEETGVINYEAESPDETAFVTAAREFGFEFYKRTQSSVHLKEFDPAVREFSCREYKILDLLEFNSTRKRMSVIIRDSEGQLFLFCKGADSVMFERLADNGRAYEQATKEHLTSYGEAGLRTLVIAYRKLVESEYSEWRAVFLTAKSTVGAERESLLDDASAMIEKDLILIGATAVEDKLQKGVPECIDRLAQAGLKIWVLTGDKLETAINIGFACSLLREGMKQIVVTMDNETITKTANEVICQQIVDGQQQIENETDPEAAYALIIDGKALTFGLQPNSKDKLLHLALNCASVICCRVSPKQKALVTKLVRESTQKVTLAIGDGANDVGMIQEADIGVGISGVEGMQAVMASDFAIAQFRFLEHLLLVHGHWCYKRISLMVCYFFYKNLTFGLTLFYFEAHTRFSGQAMYNDWAMSLFNVAFTSLPVMALGIFEQDVTAQVCLQFPALYHQGPTNLFFNWFHIMGWICNAIYNSILTFFVGARIYKTQAFCNGGQTAGIDVMGTSMYTCIISTLTFQISLVMTYFTWIQHFCIWGSILVWYVFLVVYGFITPSISSTAYKLFVEVLSPSPKYWLVTIVVTTACLLPYFAFMVFQQAFKPMDHQIIEEIKYMQKDKKEPQMWINEQAKAILHTLIGTTARVEAKIKKLLLRVQERK